MQMLEIAAARHFRSMPEDQHMSGYSAEVAAELPPAIKVLRCRHADNFEMLSSAGVVAGIW